MQDWKRKRIKQKNEVSNSQGVPCTLGMFSIACSSQLYPFIVIQIIAFAPSLWFGSQSLRNLLNSDMRRRADAVTTSPLVSWTHFPTPFGCQDWLFSNETRSSCGWQQKAERREHTTGSHNSTFARRRTRSYLSCSDGHRTVSILTDEDVGSMEG